MKYMSTASLYVVCYCDPDGEDPVALLSDRVFTNFGQAQRFAKGVAKMMKDDDYADPQFINVLTVGRAISGET